MALYTASDLRMEAGLTASASAEHLRREAKTGANRFDIFLSHSMQDAQLVLGLRKVLASGGFSVYVDWIDDPELDRSKVTAVTADRLRSRMKQSRTLVYATSRSATRSRWMPWELGYFDGLRGGNRVSIMPIENHNGGQFVGQEYLGLYKRVERVTHLGVRQPFAVKVSESMGEPLRSFVNGDAQFWKIGS